MSPLPTMPAGPSDSTPDVAVPLEFEHAVAPFAPPLRVLFLCPTNAARSQIAEALLERKGGGRFVVASAGPVPAPRIHPGALRALASVGIDWSARTPRGLEAVAAMPWDAIIVTCDRSREWCPSLHGRPVYAHWGIPDPVHAAAAAPVDAAFTATLAHDDAFVVTTQLLTWRIDLMLALRPELLVRAVVDAQLGAVARSVPQGDSIPAR